MLANRFDCFLRQDLAVGLDRLDAGFVAFPADAGICGFKYAQHRLGDLRADPVARNQDCGAFFPAAHDVSC